MTYLTPEQVEAVARIAAAFPGRTTGKPGWVDVGHPTGMDESPGAPIQVQVYVPQWDKEGGHRERPLIVSLTSSGIPTNVILGGTDA